MPRSARVVIPGCPVHIVHRGVDHAPTFRSPGDFRLYLGLLAEASARGDCAVNAYVLMTNHVHLLLSTQDERGPARFMKLVAQRHAQYCNRHWGRSGPLWEGRFKSNIVQTHRYALHCHRYIEENPLRAGMVRNPADYPWSSFRAKAFGVPCDWLVQDEVCEALGEDVVGRRLAYRALFDAPQDPGLVEQIRSSIQGGFALGAPDFVREVEASSGRRLRRVHRSKIRGAHRKSAEQGLSPK